MNKTKLHLSFWIDGFDYGCGYGEDVKFLNKQGFQTNGWDPHYFPKNELQKADVVNLGYVLNVIENEQERREALKMPGI